MTTSDEREALNQVDAVLDVLRTVVNNKAPSQAALPKEACESLLALLDAPRLPRPEEVPPEVLDEMCLKLGIADGSGRDDMRAALQVHYDHCKAPPKKPRDAYGVDGGGTTWTVFESKRAALAYADDFPGSRIIKLVEDRDGE